MLWMKLAIPVAMVTVGGGALVAAATTDDPAPTGPARVWIDAPTGLTPFAPGPVAVAAHATADDSITKLSLSVDGTTVATDATLDRNGRLVYGEFSWKAEAGTHELRVAQVGGAGVASDVLVVEVADGAPAAPAPTTTTTTGSTTTTDPDASTTSSSSTSTSTSTTETTVPPGTDDTTPVTLVPTTRPPAPTTTVPPAPRPAILEAYFLGSSTVYQYPSCAYTAKVQASTRNAQRATLVVEGTSFRTGMDRSGDTFTATITSGFAPSEIGSHSVVIQVIGPGGSAQQTVGTLVVKPACPKD